MPTLEAGLSTSSLDRLIKSLESYKAMIELVGQRLVADLAALGAVKAKTIYDWSVLSYDDPTDITVVYDIVADTATITFRGTDIAFIEFGAGAAYGYGYIASEATGRNYAGDNGIKSMGPGTYNPESPNWNDPNGWYYFRDGEIKHTKGNPPACAIPQTIDFIVSCVTEDAISIMEELNGGGIG